MISPRSSMRFRRVDSEGHIASAAPSFELAAARHAQRELVPSSEYYCELSIGTGVTECIRR